MRRIILGSFFILCSQFCRGQQDKIISAAHGKLAHFLEGLPKEQEARFGFTPGEDLTKCQLGKPYELLIFSDKFYSDTIIESKSYITSEDEWLVPVTYNGEYRAFLTVEREQGNYQVAELGESAFAKELRDKHFTNNTAQKYSLLSIDEISANFLVRIVNGSFRDAKYLPLRSALSAIPALHNAHSKYYTLTEVQKMVKNVLMADKYKE